MTEKHGGVLIHFKAPIWNGPLLLLRHFFLNTFNCLRTGITKNNKASQAIQSPRTVPFFLLVSLLDGYSFPNVLVKGIIAFKH